MTNFPVRGGGFFSGRFIPACASVRPILNNDVPHSGQTPREAGVPFFVKTACASLISRFVLHFTQ